MAYYCDIEDELAVITSSFESTGIISVLTNTALITDLASETQSSVSYEEAVITSDSDSPVQNVTYETAPIVSTAPSSLASSDTSYEVAVTSDNSTWVAGGRVDETAPITDALLPATVVSVLDDAAVIVSTAYGYRTVTNDTVEAAVLDDTLYSFLPSDLTDAAVVTSSLPSASISSDIADTAVITSTAPYALRFQDLTYEIALISGTLTDRAVTENISYEDGYISGVSLVDGAHTAWVTHVKQLAMSRFESLTSTSVMRVGNSILGFGFESVNVMTNDAPVDAFVLNGALGKDASHVKRIPNVYVSGEAWGPMALTVFCDDDGDPVEYEYPFELRRNISTRNNRVALGKGLRSRYWQFKFSNTGGEYFALRTAAADTAITSRRL